MTVPAILNSFEVENIDENVYLFGGYGFLEQEYSGIRQNKGFDENLDHPQNWPFI